MTDGATLTDTGRLAAAIEHLARVLEPIAEAVARSHTTDARAGQGTTPPKPIGTPVASVNVKNNDNDDVRPSVRYDGNGRTDGRKVSWQELTDEIAAVDCSEIRLSCARISKVVKAKQGVYRQDRRLIVVAAVLARRFDAGWPDQFRGTHWLDDALRQITEARPDNSAAMFQTILKRELRTIDAALADPPTAHLAWIQLANSVKVPEKWLVNPEAAGLKEAERRYLERA